jgi:hypothetical protein
MAQRFFPRFFEIRIKQTPASKVRQSLDIGVPELFLKLLIDFWRFHQNRWFFKRICG